MVFVMEEVTMSEAIYSYHSNTIFDEILEFYTFLNSWAVKPLENDTM